MLELDEPLHFRILFTKLDINNWAFPRLGLDSTVAGLLLKPMQSIWILCSGVVKSELTAIVYPSSRKKLALISFGLCNCQVAFTNLDAGSVFEGVSVWRVSMMASRNFKILEALTIEYRKFLNERAAKDEILANIFINFNWPRGQIMVSQDMCSLTRWSDILNL